ncbi:ATP-binding cassette domain-containing protein [Paenibacillus sp. GCM10012307]|uniref:ABC transporter ATP-binding protein n=1 Tax=Paenibacillus roseus TaxID=2798579 RepID=A0A934MJQ3_9BACL|nr:ABC transporter ATP-binding protein [Paenibacillus roseus]MBJ6360160.1 ABC transporter ATP-binding protein [Paenibacillus roseus]
MNSGIPLHIKQLVKQQDDIHLGPIDLELEPNMTYALLGPNSSGKSTLLKCCMNLMKPASGIIEIYGRSYPQDEHRIKQLIAFAPDPLEGCELFTLGQMGDMIAPWYASWERSHFLRRAEQFKVPLDKRYEKMSQGERKKVALTLALSTQAPVLLLDEPTNGLDINSRNRFKEMLVEDAERIERTVLMTTHAIEDIRQFADQILLLKNGRIEGPLEKDRLIQSWRRVWLSADKLPDLSVIPGVVEYNGYPYPHLITRNWQETLDSLNANQIPIVRDQPLSLDELMERLLNE